MLHLNRGSRFALRGITIAASAIMLLGASALAVSAASSNIAATGGEVYGFKNIANTSGIPTGDVTPQTAIATIIATALSVVGVVAVVIILYAGFLWLTSAGSEEKISQAKKLLGGAVVGLLIIFSAYAISSFIIGNLKSAANTIQVNVNTNLPPNPESPVVNCSDDAGCVDSGAGYTCEIGVCTAPVTCESSGFVCGNCSPNMEKPIYTCISPLRCCPN